MVAALPNRRVSKHRKDTSAEQMKAAAILLEVHRRAIELGYIEDDGDMEPVKDFPRATVYKSREPGEDDD